MRIIQCAALFLMGHPRDTNHNDVAAAAIIIHDAYKVKLPQHASSIAPTAFHLSLFSHLLSKLTSIDHKLFHVTGLAFSGNGAFSGQSFCGDDEFCRDEPALVGETNLCGDMFAVDLPACWSGGHEASLPMPYSVLSA